MTRDELKKAAAEKAVEQVESGMVLGLGTGSTAAFVIARVGELVAQGTKVVAIPTSERTAQMSRELGIPLGTLAEYPRIDLAIDGADEVERGNLNLIKGLGGALLREKIVAAASRRFVVVVDSEKLVDHLGHHTGVPVEVAQFGWQATAVALEKIGARPQLRLREDHAFVTDGGNYILDCRFDKIEDSAELERLLNMTVGVVDNGLFVGRTSQVIVASDTGISVLENNRNPRG